MIHSLICVYRQCLVGNVLLYRQTDQQHNNYNFVLRDLEMEKKNSETVLLLFFYIDLVVSYGDDGEGSEVVAQAGDLCVTVLSHVAAAVRETSEPVVQLLVPEHAPRSPTALRLL